MKKLTLSILLVLTLMACEDRIKFEEPQPSNQRDLKKIPRKLRGTYFSTSDSTYLVINDVTIIDCMNAELRILKDSLDIEIDSTKIVNQSSDGIKVEYRKIALLLRTYGDSILVNYTYRDTLFEISERQVLRRLKGHYFLNYMWSETNWKVRRLTLENNQLTFSKVRLPEDITSLQEITNVNTIESDSGKVIGYKLKPTKGEMRKLVKQGFSETKSYKK
ncbi:MAG: hypothetical protein ABJG41_16275 [Cyclobacteriaceae bacterium]